MAGSRLLWPLGAMALYGASAVQAQPQLPEGPGKAVIEQACLGCHDSGYSRQDWQNVVHMMLNVGAPVPPDQVAGLTDYLAKNFPEKPKPAPSLITGSAHVEIKEWMVPTPGSRPHDPLAYPDGSIWYTGHMANLLGRLDPHSGKITEYHPDTPSSGPHGLWSPTGTATSGSPATSPAISASSIRSRASSPTIRCRIRMHVTRTRRCSTGASCCGSRCRVPTWSAGSTRGAARSGW